MANFHIISKEEVTDEEEALWATLLLDCWWGRRLDLEVKEALEIV